MPKKNKKKKDDKPRAFGALRKIFTDGGKWPRDILLSLCDEAMHTIAEAVNQDFEAKLQQNERKFGPCPPELRKELLEDNMKSFFYDGFVTNLFAAVNRRCDDLTGCPYPKSERLQKVYADWLLKKRKPEQGTKK